MAAPTYYNPDTTTLLLGAVAISGFAADTAIVVSRSNAQNIIPTAGVNGDVALAINKDRLGTMTISLQNTSTSNEYLNIWQAALDLDTTSSITPFFPVVLLQEDLNITIATWGWVESQPDFTLGQEVGQLDWVIGLKDATLGSIETSVAEAITAATVD